MYMMPQLKDWSNASVDRNDLVAKMTGLALLQGLNSNMISGGDQKSILLNADGKNCYL
jgi:hypothetical protein